jgi:hypothetical protein
MRGATSGPIGADGCPTGERVRRWPSRRVLHPPLQLVWVRLEPLLVELLLVELLLLLRLLLVLVLRVVMLWQLEHVLRPRRGGLQLLRPEPGLLLRLQGPATELVSGVAHL